MNQLLAGLAFLVIAFYLIRYDKPVWFLTVPGALMVVLPAWAMWSQIIGWYKLEKWLLVTIGVVIEILQIWMIVEGVIMWNKAKGVLPQPLPALQPATVPDSTNEGGRSC